MKYEKRNCLDKQKLLADPKLTHTITNINMHFTFWLFHLIELWFYGCSKRNLRIFNFISVRCDDFLVVFIFNSEIFSLNGFSWKDERKKVIVIIIIKDQRFCFAFYSLLPFGGKFYRIVLIKLFVQQYNQHTYKRERSSSVMCYATRDKRMSKSQFAKKCEIVSSSFYSSPKLNLLQFTRYFLYSCVPTSPWAISFISFHSQHRPYSRLFFVPFADDI